MTVFLYTSSLYKLAKHICMNSKLIRLTTVRCLPVGIRRGETIIYVYMTKKTKKVMCHADEKISLS